MSAVDLFRALGDPLRLHMVERLSESGSHTITSLFKGIKISRQGARKHLQILEDANVITLSQNGRETNVRLDRKTLERGKKFIASLELKWEKRLGALKLFVEKK